MRPGTCLRPDLAVRLATKARESGSPRSLIPLYVNLKEFQPTRRPVDADAVRSFIVESLTRRHVRDIDQFIADEFDRGMREGTWLLLLDSFDEIPDVLSSTESDDAVGEYARAIDDFLSGVRRSRVIIASREFRGPAAFNVPRFRIVNLTARQQADLIRKSGLRPAAQGDVRAGLAVADPELRESARNPMFLSLVCEHVRSAGAFPASSHEAYDSFLEQRLRRDADRLRQGFGVSTGEVRAVAEEVAFAMTATAGLGLSPSRADLRAAFAPGGLISLRLLDKVLDALVYAKLGRKADDPAGSGAPHFTFAHRRFQEYFATKVVLRAPDRVPVRELLANGRWRETAVTILQTQPAESTRPLLTDAAKLLAPMAETAEAVTPEPGSIGFPWPAQSMHLLRLLDAGLGRAPEHLGDEIRGYCSRLLRAAWRNGRRHDRKWAVSFALVADRDTTLWLTEQAFESGSVYLGGAAYTVVSRMDSPPDGLYAGVRRTLLDLAATGQLKAERVTLKAQISRLPDAQPVLRVLGLLSAAPWIAMLIGALILAGDAIVLPWLIIADAIAFPLYIDAFRMTFTRRGLPFEKRLAAQSTAAMLLTDAAHTQVLTTNGRIVPGVVLLTAVFYFVLWPLSLERSCQKGYVTAAPGWPLAPFIVLGAEVRPATLASRRFLRWLAISGTVGAVGAGVGVALAELWDSGNGVARSTAHAGAVVLLAPVVVAEVITFGWFTQKLLEYLGRRRLDAGLIRGLADSDADAVSVLAALGEAQTARGVTRVLGWACRVDLAKSPDLLRLLSDVSAIIEQKVVIDETRQPPTMRRLLSAAAAFIDPTPTVTEKMKTAIVQQAGLSPEVHAWLTGLSLKKLARLREAGEADVDMMTRAIEQAELERQREGAVR